MPIVRGVRIESGRITLVGGGKAPTEGGKELPASGIASTFAGFICLTAGLIACDPVCNWLEVLS